MAGTDKAWEKWARTDPYFGVVTWEQFRKDNVQFNRDEFFETGRATVEKVLSIYKRNFGAIPTGKALDYGCGVGRLTLALAEHFTSVDGFDISPSMLKEAVVNGRGRPEIAFLPADDSLTKAGEGYAFALTYIVLQHIEPSRGINVIRAMVDKLKPGGGFAIHVSLRTWGAAKAWLYSVKNRVPFIYILSNALRGQPLTTPPMEMNAYSLPMIMNALHDRGCSEFSVFTERHSDVLTACIIGKKAE